MFAIVRGLSTEATSCLPLERRRKYPKTEDRDAEMVDKTFHVKLNFQNAVLKLTCSLLFSACLHKIHPACRWSDQNIPRLKTGMQRCETPAASVDKAFHVKLNFQNAVLELTCSLLFSACLRQPHPAYRWSDRNKKNTCQGLKGLGFREPDSSSPAEGLLRGEISGPCHCQASDALCGKLLRPTALAFCHSRGPQEGTGGTSLLLQEKPPTKALCFAQAAHEPAIVCQQGARPEVGAGARSSIGLFTTPNGGS